MKPDVLGIGVQKGASTWLYNVLEDHPQAVMSTKKEIDFFSYYYDHGFQWYENNFPINKPSAQVKGEISPSYFYTKEAIKRAYAYNPDFKIIVSLRHPVDRLYSNHLHEIRLEHFYGHDLSIEAGLKNNPMYIEQSLYYKHLKDWYQQFPKENILVFFQEEIKHNALKEAEKLYDFLGIDKQFKSSFLQRKANPSAINRYPGIDQGIKKLGKLGRRVGLDVLVNKVKNMDAVVKLRNKNLIHLSDIVPPINSQKRQELNNLFSDDMNKLEQLLERKLPWDRAY